MGIKIGETLITNEGRPYFIADIAANHDGDLGRAYKLIELAKESGADVAKFQNFKAQTIVSKLAFDAMPKQTHQAKWSKSVYEVYDEAAIADEWTAKLKEKCDGVGIEYMTSPYDFDAIDSVDKYVNAYKVGSGDITWLEIIEYMAKKGKPILLATGAANIEEVKAAMECVEKYTKDIVLMQCNTNYTASEENFKHINLNVLRTYRELFPDCVLGLSDHTFGHSTVVGAIALGARVIEKHFTDDNGRVGPDHKFAMNPTTWKNMVKSSIEVWEALGDGVKKVEDNELNSRIVQQRSLFVKKDMKAGETITREDIIPLRPIMADGIKPDNMDKVVGRTLCKDISAGNHIRWEDIE
ncbi:MAG: N-acetylneuraminate synthase family protein [Lachnospiraceae bacterium]|nr:N-acetylneuraminate synthase family protein [Lachnospiraceae bacterium]